MGAAPASPWDRAREFGIDMSVIEANLRLSPATRVWRHARALATLTALRHAKDRHRART